MPLPIAPAPRPVVPAVPTTMPAPTAAQVKRAETFLRRAGFNPGPVDGRVTPAFTKALEQFQAAWGLPATGLLDARTSERLTHTAKRVARHHGDQFLSIGEKSKAIKVVEQRLARLGYDVGKLDGVYSRETGAAVKAFREDQPELKDDRHFIGKLGRSVLAREVKALQHAPERRRLAPSASQTRVDRATAKAVAVRHADGSMGLGEGSTGAAVKNVQRHLRAAGFDPQRLDGRMDERSVGALKAFQKKAGLEVTGRVTPKTWAALQKSFILSKRPAAPAQRLGERSGAVNATEALLEKAGFNPGKVDGLFDRRTERAVRAFERKFKLDGDGAIGTGELAKLKKAAQGGDYRQKVLETARRYLGFSENGNNVNPFSKFFGRPPEPWCADFVSYCYTKAGKKLNQAWTPALLQTLKDNGTHTLTRPRPGDIVMFDWNPSSGYPAEHTGLVEKVFRKNGRLYVQTIEGNSGNAVRRLSYAVGDPRIAGFGTIR